MRILRTLTGWHKPEWWELPMQLLLSGREKDLPHGESFVQTSFSEGLVKGFFDYHSGRC